MISDKLHSMMISAIRNADVIINLAKEQDLTIFSRLGTLWINTTKILPSIEQFAFEYMSKKTKNSNVQCQSARLNETLRQCETPNTSLVEKETMSVFFSWAIKPELIKITKVAVDKDSVMEVRINSRIKATRDETLRFV